MLKKTQGVGPIRKVVLVKDDHEGLGISITVRSCFIFCSWQPLDVAPKIYLKQLTIPCIWMQTCSLQMKQMFKQQGINLNLILMHNSSVAKFNNKTVNICKSSDIQEFTVARSRPCFHIFQNQSVLGTKKSKVSTLILLWVVDWGMSCCNAQRLFSCR